MVAAGTIALSKAYVGCWRDAALSGALCLGAGLAFKTTFVRFMNALRTSDDGSCEA